EWEYACRAGTTTQYSFGDDVALLDQYGWHKMNSNNKSHPVGTLNPNPFGLFDMHGNLNEWCGDLWVTDWYKKSPPNDPVCLSGGVSRMSRSSFYASNAATSRSAFRYSDQPHLHYGNFGFRIV